MASTKTTKTETTTHHEFNYEEVRKALGLPENAKIWVQVPGGGDWSNAKLDIGRDVMLEAESVEVEIT